MDWAEGAEARTNSEGGKGETCSTPELSPAGGGEHLLLAWSQRRRGESWRGKVILLQQGRTVAETILSENKDLLFPQAQAGPDGRWSLDILSGSRSSAGPCFV
jgi:hypothetical protein